MIERSKILFRLEVVLVVMAWLLSLVPATAFAQQIKKSSELESAQKLLVTDPAEAIQAAGRLSQLARKNANGRERSVGIANALSIQAEAELRLGRLGDAQQSYLKAKKALAAISEPLDVKGQLLLTRGGIQSAEGNAAQALASYQNAFRVFQSLTDRRRQALALALIASLYREGRDFSRAERYFQQATELYSGDPLFELSMRNNRGNVLRQLERFDDAIREYRRALSLADELKSPMLKARILTNIARNQLEKGDLDAAGATLKNAKQLTATGEASAWRPQVLALTARYVFLRGYTKYAGQLIDEAFAGVDPAKAPLSLRDANDIAYEIYAKLGESGKALAHLEAVREMDKEAAKVSASTNAALMAARFDFQNQELKIARLRADDLKNKIELERSRAEFQRTLFISIALAVALLIAVMTYGIIKLRRSRNRERLANVELNRTNEALEKALAAKTEFLATTSHEIRTPLNGILGMTQVMLADPRLDANLRDRIGVVHGAGVTMRALVDDILDVAKMETGNLTVEAVPMDLTTTLRDVSRMWEEQARGRNLDFELDIANAPDWIESDPSRLRQIIFNLLSNAIKFTEAGSVGIKACRAEGETGERLRIMVHDSGVGIPQDKLEEVFESFKQADTSTTRKFGGTGLGLAICRNLARALGGDIELESTVGTGSRFTLDLPLVAVAAPEQKAADDGCGNGMIVLDRNPIARGMLKSLFEPHCPNLAFLTDRTAALQAIEAGGASLLLIDAATLAADGVDPIEPIGELAKAAQGKNMRTVVLWTRPSEEENRAVMTAGADLCIAKPVGGAALVKALFGEATQKGENQALVSHAA